MAAGDPGGLLLGVGGGPVRDLVGALGHASENFFSVWSSGWVELVDVLVGCGAGHHPAMPVEDALIAPLFGLQFLDSVLDGNRAVSPRGAGGRGLGFGGGRCGFVGGVDGAPGGIVGAGNCVAVAAFAVVTDLDRLAAGRQCLHGALLSVPGVLGGSSFSSGFGTEGFCPVVLSLRAVSFSIGDRAVCVVDLDAYRVVRIPSSVGLRNSAVRQRTETRWTLRKGTCPLRRFVRSSSIRN